MCLNAFPSLKKTAAVVLAGGLAAGLPGVRTGEAAAAVKVAASARTGMPGVGALNFAAVASSLSAPRPSALSLPTIASLTGMNAHATPSAFAPAPAIFSSAMPALTASVDSAIVVGPRQNLSGVVSIHSTPSGFNGTAVDLKLKGARPSAASVAGEYAANPSALPALDAVMRLTKEIAAASSRALGSSGAVSSLLSKFFSERPSRDGAAVAVSVAKPFSSALGARPPVDIRLGQRLLAAAEFDKESIPSPASTDNALAVSLFEQTSSLSARLTRWEAVTAAVGVGVAVAAALSGAFSGVSTTAYIFFSLATMLQVIPRTRALIHFQSAWPRPDKEKSGARFSSLFKGEKRARSSASWGRLAGLGGLAGAGVLAWAVAGSNPVLAALIVLASLPLFPTLKAAVEFGRTANLLKIALLSGLRAGREPARSEGIPGATALEKRYWFLATGGLPVAKLSHTYRQLLASGLPMSQALFTALSSHILFAQKTQKGLTRADKKRLGLGFFDIYLPYLIQAQSLSNTRIYAGKGNAKGLTPGELDMSEFEDMFRLYASGRDYMTASDFKRMRKGNSARDAGEGRGNSLTRWFGEQAAKRRSDQLMMLFPDRVVFENGLLVPAIGRGMLLRFYQGSAQYDIMAERKP